MFFKKKARIAPTKTSFNLDMKEYQVPYSKGFRGFKTFPLVVYGKEEIMANNEKYYNKDFSNSTFVFKCYNCENGERAASLYIDGVIMGTAFRPDQLFAVENDLIEKIHIEPEEEVVLGDKRTETRHRIRALVKYAKMDED